MKYESIKSEQYISPSNHITVTKKTITGESSIHFHEFFEIEIILDGAGTQMLNGSDYALKRGSVYLLTPADFHKVTTAPSLDLINIMFDECIVSKPLLAALLSKQNNLFFTLSEKQEELFYPLCEMLVEEKSTNDVYSELCIKNLMDCLIAGIIRGTDEITDTPTQGKNQLLNEAIGYLYTHFRENPPLSRLAAICGYSTNYFSRLFTELTGKGYSDFLNTIKINHARMLLSSTDKSVAEIAFACGFTSLSNFYRVFGNEAQTTPLEYREKSIVLRKESSN